jgi:hypothetical protein
MKAATILTALVLPALAPSAMAQQVGQYAVVTAGGNVLIVDSKNGYVWEWNPSVAGFTGAPDINPRLVYQGQVIPGKDSGPSGAHSPPQK